MALCKDCEAQSIALEQRLWERFSPQNLWQNELD